MCQKKIEATHFLKRACRGDCIVVDGAAVEFGGEVKRVAGKVCSLDIFGEGVNGAVMSIFARVKSTGVS